MSDGMDTYNEIEEEMLIEINNDNDGSTTTNTTNDCSEKVTYGSSNVFSEKLSTAIKNSEEEEDYDDNNDRDIPSPVESESSFPSLSDESEQWLSEWMVVNQEMMKICPLQDNELRLVAPYVYNEATKWINQENTRNNDRRH